MDYIEELTNEYDNIEDILKEQGVDMGRQDKEKEDE